MVVASFDGGDRALYFNGELANPGPAGGGEHQDCEAALPQVLLVAAIGVGVDQQLIALLLSQANQVPFGDGGSTQLASHG